MTVKICLAIGYKKPFPDISYRLVYRGGVALKKSYLKGVVVAKWSPRKKIPNFMFMPFYKNMEKQFFQESTFWWFQKYFVWKKFKFLDFWRFKTRLMEKRKKNWDKIFVQIYQRGKIWSNHLYFCDNWSLKTPISF